MSSAVQTARHVRRTSIPQINSAVGYSTPVSRVLNDMFSSQPLDESLSTAELSHLVGRLADTPSAWAPRIRRPERDRWWTKLYGDSFLDIWLLTWLPGHMTDPHDHGDAAAALIALRGVFEEIRPSPAAGRSVSRLRVGQTARIQPGVIHDLRAVEGSPAATIHAYSPPLTVMNYWKAGSDGRLRPDHSVYSNEPEQQDQPEHVA